MGDLIDATGRFRMRRLERDVERAESSELWGTSIITRTRLANKQEAVDLANMKKELNDWMHDIILPPNLEED